MTEMFSLGDQRQHVQPAPGCMMTHSAKLCLSASQTRLFQVDIDEMLISGCDYYHRMRASSLSRNIRYSALTLTRMGMGGSTLTPSQLPE